MQEISLLSIGNPCQRTNVPCYICRELLRAVTDFRVRATILRKPRRADFRHISGVLPDNSGLRLFGMLAAV
jgi:hypothetical protein